MNYALWGVPVMTVSSITQSCTVKNAMLFKFFNSIELSGAVGTNKSKLSAATNRSRDISHIENRRSTSDSSSTQEFIKHTQGKNEVGRAVLLWVTYFSNCSVHINGL